MLCVIHGAHGYVLLVIILLEPALTVELGGDLFLVNRTSNLTD